MKFIFPILLLGLLSFNKIDRHTLHTERLPVLFFNENSLEYSGKLESNETLKDTTEILYFMKSFMEKSPTMTIEIQGHTDFIEKTKNEIAIKRAEKVYSELIKLGVGENRLTIKGYADTKPRMTVKMMNSCNKDNECIKATRQYNRRVSFKLTHG